MSPTVRLIQKLLAPLQRRVRLMVARAIVELVDDAKTCQTLQVSVRADELRDDVERFQQYGLTSVPAPGAEALLLFVGGNADHGVVVAIEDRTCRPTNLAEGEVALYTRDHAIRFHAKADGTVLLGTTPTDFVALAALVDARLGAIQAAYDAHTHPTGVGPSGPPAALIGALEPTAATEVKAK